MVSRNIVEIPPAICEKLLLYVRKVDASAKIDFDSLRYLTVPYFGYDNKLHTGELIVHASVAPEVFEIFLEMFEDSFPIERMKLIEHYHANDEASMEDNNSSAFCYRYAVAKPGMLSKHSYGLAIDINPLYNPYVKNDLILPPQAKPYVDRSREAPGLIHTETSCYKAFTKRGWTWGGDWPDRQDYQHFEKG